MYLKILYRVQVEAMSIANEQRKPIRYLATVQRSR